MPVDLRCDRCGRKIASVSYEKIREYVQQNGETCGKCLQMEEKLKEYFIGSKKRFEKRFNQLIEKALDDLKQETARLSGVPDSDGE